MDIIKVIEKLEDRICEELNHISSNTGRMSSAEVDSMQKIIVSEEKLIKIKQMSGSSQRRYSGDGKWYAMGDYDNRDNSYGEHYVRGHYSRDDGMMMDRMNDGMYDRMSREDRQMMGR